MFFHIACNSLVANAAFVTSDGNFLNRSGRLHQRYGITVLGPNSAWQEFAPRYALVEPAPDDISRLAADQQHFFGAIRRRQNAG